LLARLTANPLFASIAIVFGLLIWLNLIARLTLISTAWVANDFDEIHDVERQALAHQPDTVAAPGTRSSHAHPLPTFGTRSGDRTTLAAGAVLGAAAMIAAGTLARGIRSVVGLARR